MLDRIFFFFFAFVLFCFFFVEGKFRNRLLKSIFVRLDKTMTKNSQYSNLRDLEILSTSKMYTDIKRDYWKKTISLLQNAYVCVCVFTCYIFIHML